MSSPPLRTTPSGASLQRSAPPLRTVSSVASYERDRQPDDPLARVNTNTARDNAVDDEQAIAEAALGNRALLQDASESLDDDVYLAEKAASYHEHSESDSGIEKDHDKILHDSERRAEVRRIQSYATDVSTTTQATSHHAAGADRAHKTLGQRINPFKWGAVPPVPREREVSREYHASFLSKLFFSWQGSLMRVGYKRPLEQNDIWTVNPDRSVYKMSQDVHQAFHRRLAAGQKLPLLRALNEVYKHEFWLGGSFQLASTVFQVMSPFTLRFLIQYATEAYEAHINGTPQPSIGRGLGLVFGVTIMQILQSLGTNHFIYKGMLVGGMARAALISLIYEKSMVVSGRAKAGGKASEETPKDPSPGGQTEEEEEEKKDTKRRFFAKKSKKEGGAKPQNKVGLLGDGVGWGNGRVVSLMSVDTYRIDQASGLFHIIWTAPISCVLTLILLLINLSYSALSGFALLVIGLPLLTRAIKSLFRRRQHINKVTDQRVGLTQEILQSVRFVKYFGWESSFLSRLAELRGKEIGMIQKLMSIRNAIMAVSLSLPIFASMLSFITYSLSDNSLAPSTVFSSLALFNGLRMPLNLLPLVIGQVTDAWNSLKRIEEYLLLEEQSDDATFDAEAPNAVEMRHASFTWERTPTQESDKTAGMGKKGGAGKVKGAAALSEKAGAAKRDSSSTLVEEREPFKLHDMHFEIGRNELVAVIGSVGSGKTSLLAALAGDMRRTSGETVLGASRAFCPQYAWIQNSTLRDNIVFGKEMNRSWYKRVIKACVTSDSCPVLPPFPPYADLCPRLTFRQMCFATRPGHVAPGRCH